MHDPPKAVFYDPSGRRRRVLVVLLTVIAAIAAAAVALLIIGLRGGQPPRIFVEQDKVPSMTSVTPHSTRPHPTDLPPLPSLPAIP